MKSDTTTTALNLILAALVLSGVFFAYLSIMRTREFRTLTGNASQANTQMMRAQGLANDASVYNAKVNSPELTRILQTVVIKPVAK